MRNVISLELRLLRKDLINRLKIGQQPFAPVEMTTLLSLINDFLKSSNGSFLSLLYYLWLNKMELYIPKLIFLKSQLRTKIKQVEKRGYKYD
jgi:hypothetical protein